MRTKGDKSLILTTCVLIVLCTPIVETGSDCISISGTGEFESFEELKHILSKQRFITDSRGTCTVHT